MSTQNANSDTLAQQNRKYWDTASQSVLKDDWVAKLQEQIAAFLIDPENDAWIGLPPAGVNSKMLDYACGDGLPSRTLKPRIRTCTGVDISAGMLEKYNEHAKRLGLGPDEMLGVRGDLLAAAADDDDDASAGTTTTTATEPPLPAERLRDLDLVAVCMALHHMEDVGAAVARLASRLRPGGTLLIIDWARIQGSAPTQGGPPPPVTHSAHGDPAASAATAPPSHLYRDPHDHHKPHPASHTISHDSFTEPQMDALFAAAGCGDFRWRLADKLSDVPGARSGKMQLFWARATKQ